MEEASVSQNKFFDSFLRARNTPFWHFSNSNACDKPASHTVSGGGWVSSESADVRRISS